MPWPVLIDDLDGRVQTAYGGLAAAVYLLDADGARRLLRHLGPVARAPRRDRRLLARDAAARQPARAPTADPPRRRHRRRPARPHPRRLPLARRPRARLPRRARAHELGRSRAPFSPRSRCAPRRCRRRRAPLSSSASSPQEPPWGCKCGTAEASRETSFLGGESLVERACPDLSVTSSTVRARHRWRSVQEEGGGAGEGNRTLVWSLEGSCSAIELRPPRDRGRDPGPLGHRYPFRGPVHQR